MRKRSLAFILISLMVSVNLSNTEYLPPEYFEDQNTSTEVSPNNTSNPIEVDMAFLGPFSERMGATYGTGYRAAADIAIEHMNEKQTKYATDVWLSGMSISLRVLFEKNIRFDPLQDFDVLAMSRLLQ